MAVKHLGADFWTLLPSMIYPTLNGMLPIEKSESG
jgi:hypothetical protein